MQDEIKLEMIMFRYIGIPLIAGGLTTALLAASYVLIGGPPRTPASQLPDRSRITAVTVGLDAHGNHSEIPAFDIPDSLRSSFLSKVYGARLVDWDYYANGEPNDGGERLTCIGFVRLFGWGELQTDWGENDLHAVLLLYRLASRPDRLCFVFREFPISEGDRWLIYAADLDDAIREAHADHLAGAPTGVDIPKPPTRRRNR